MNYRQLKAIEYKNKERIKKNCPEVTENSGIYILYREENGFKFAYVGQAKHLLSRLAQHLSGYQHIDNSIKKHKFYNEENPTGYKIAVKEFPIDKLDEMEQFYIKKLANEGFQLRNKTAGSQGIGKTSLENGKQAKTYRQGLQQGYKNAQKFVANLFDKHLKVGYQKENPNKNAEKAMEKFVDFLDYEETPHNSNENNAE